MTVENPQLVTINGVLFKLCREALVLVPYPDGTYKTGPKKGQAKWSQGPASQTNYSVDPLRPVEGSDPPINLHEALRWSVLGMLEREKTINRLLKVTITPGQFDAVLCCYYQRGNVRLPPPDEVSFLECVVALFNAEDHTRALASFMRFNSGADNKPTDGHTKRRAGEILMGYGMYGDISKVPFWTGNPNTTEREFVDSSQLVSMLRELAPDRF